MATPPGPGLAGCHEATRKTAHPSLKVPASVLSSFHYKVLFPGESHPWQTGQTPYCDPQSRPNYLSCVPQSSQAPAVLSLRAASSPGAWFAHHPPARPWTPSSCAGARPGSRGKAPLLATSQALYRESAPYPDCKCSGKPDDFITS